MRLRGRFKCKNNALCIYYKNNFEHLLIMNTYEKTVPVLQKHQKANVRIVISNKTLWLQVFG